MDSFPTSPEVQWVSSSFRIHTRRRCFSVRESVYGTSIDTCSPMELESESCTSNHMTPVDPFYAARHQIVSFARCQSNKNRSLPGGPESRRKSSQNQRTRSERDAMPPTISVLRAVEIGPCASRRHCRSPCRDDAGEACTSGRSSTDWTTPHTFCGSTSHAGRAPRSSYTASPQASRGRALP